MKAILIGLSALTLSGAVIAQDNETISGNGKSVTRDVSVTPFTSIKASGVYELRLAQGDKESVRVEADENFQEYITVHNEGDQLVVDMKKAEHKNLKNTHKMRVYVTFKALRELNVSTVGNVVSESPLSLDNLTIRNKSVGNIDLQLNAAKLELRNESVGNVKLTGKADEAVVRNSGVGSIRAGSFVVQTMTIENTGVGNAEVNAEKDLKVSDSFLGGVRNKGAAAAKKNKRVRA